MAENRTLARPYAEAAFALARASNTLGSWADVLALLSALSQDAGLQQVLNDPKLGREARTQFVLDVAGESLNEEQRNLISVLIDNDRFQVLPDIRDLFIVLKDQQESVLEAQVASAFPMDEATLARLIADLEQKFSAKVRAEVTVDPSLIGGVRIAIGDQVIDASVRGKLAAMSLALTNQEF